MNAAILRQVVDHVNALLLKPFKRDLEGVALLQRRGDDKHRHRRQDGREGPGKRGAGRVCARPVEQHSVLEAEDLSQAGGGRCPGALQARDVAPEPRSL